MLNSPQHHLGGDGGCKFCANEKAVTIRSGKFRRITQDEALVRFKLKFGDLFKYTFVDARTVRVECTKHGEFILSIKSHLGGNSCHECSKEKHLNRLKEDNPFAREEVKLKIKQTMLARYGYDSPCKNPDIHAKQQRYILKEHKFESGEVIKYRGYELKAILDLLNIYKYSINDLQLSNRKSIKYGDRVYHPDIIIPKENRIIEVKSTYTYNIDYEKLGKIKPAVEEAGFTFEVWIY